MRSPVFFASFARSLAGGMIGLFAFVPADPLHAQAPDTITLTKTFSFLQTSATNLADYRPALEITVSYPGTLPSTASVKLTTAGATFTLTRTSNTAAGTSSFAGGQVFADRNALNAAVPAGSYSLSLTANGTTTTTTFESFFDTAVSAPKFDNFDSLQRWTGGPLQLSWPLIPGASTADTMDLTIVRSDGVIFYDSTTLPGHGGLAGTSTYFNLVGLTTSLGDAFNATLTYTKLLGAVPFLVNSTRVSLFQKTEVRFPFKRPTPPPAITTQPRSQTVAEGRAALFAVSDVSLSPTYVWKKDGVEITSTTSGFRLLGSQLLIESARRTDAGDYTVTITNAGGSVTSAPATLTVTPNLRPPFLSNWPKTPPTVRLGENYSATAQIISTTPITVQWFHNGTLIKTATSALGIGGIHDVALTFAPFRASDVGEYYFTATNSAGTESSPLFILAVAPASRITNLSVLTSLSLPGESFTLGYVLGGQFTQDGTSLVFRAVGPSLAPFGVPTPLDDPKFELFTGAKKFRENDNWGGSTQLATTFSAVGAFPLANTQSRDAGALFFVAAGDNSVRVSATGSGTGTVLAEIYDATAEVNYGVTIPRLINVSVLKHVGTGLTLGFTVSGTGPTQVLVRAVGPTLGAPPFGVVGVLGDPQLALFDATAARLATNDNWEGRPDLAAAFAQVGAFALPPAARDAALLVTLPPGSYTAQVSGVNNTTGIALVEVYEVR